MGDRSPLRREVAREAVSVSGSSPSGSRTLRRWDRLRDSRDFRRISRRGRRIPGEAFVMLVAAVQPGGRPAHRRIGISASRRIGNAVVRNRIKRGVREWFRASRDILPEDVDIVVIARRPASGLGGPEIARALDALARRIRKPRSTPGSLRR